MWGIALRLKRDVSVVLGATNTCGSVGGMCGSVMVVLFKEEGSI